MTTSRNFFLVVMSLLDQFAADFLERFLPIPPMLLRVVRIARILRILRLLKNAKGLLPLRPAAGRRRAAKPPPTRVAAVLLLRFHVQPQTEPGTA